MRGKKIILLALVAMMATLVPLVVFAKDSETATGQAKMHPENQSGIKGKITFEDDGATLTTTGTATGLTPGAIYVSLIYDNGSVPGGPTSCEPTIFNPADPDFILPTMLVGFWVNNNDGTGTLAAINTNGGADYVPLSKFKTISIRLIIGPPPPAPLQACGQVAVHPGG